MAEIVYKSLSALTPIELKYEYYKNENLQTSKKTFNSGFSFYEIEGFNNYRDVAINKDSCFVLTSAINLSSIFTQSKQYTVGSVPVSLKIGSRLEFGAPSIYFALYNESQNTFRLTLTSYSTFYLQPVLGTNNIVEIFVNGKYVQVDEAYPYTVRLNQRSLDDPDFIGRQRFEVVYNGRDNLISFKTLTNSGYRYLSFNNDNILRATGLILNETIVNDYIFAGIPVTDNTLNYGFNPTNNWVTYYFDVESRADNKNLRVNKDFLSVPTNYLVDFPIEKAAETGSIVVNIANLKTGITPGGGPAPVNNAYVKEVITTN